MTVLELDAREDEGVAILALSGELDISSAPRVEGELSRLESREPSALVLDLSGLRFMDSTGLRIVVSADARAREQGRRFAVVRGPESVQRIFRITRLEERLRIVDSPDELGAPA